MRTFATALTLSLVLAACSPSPTPLPSAIIPTIIPTQAQELETIVTGQEALAQADNSSIQIEQAIDEPAYSSQPNAAPLPIPPDIGNPYTGYWFKLSKEFQEDGYQFLRLMYQDGVYLEEIARFCVRASNNNTPNGFLFVMKDRPTTYPTAPGVFATTYFSHNFQIKYASRSWYLHSGDWNKEGPFDCPTKNTGGCVNMRPGDFDVVLNGGEYTDPFSGKTSTVPNLGAGIPFIITDTDDACRYLGNCMETFACDSFKECFEMYSCSLCEYPEVKWNEMLSESANPEILK